MHYVILGLLLDGPMSLYDVQKRFASGLAHFYSASSGSIERALRQIVADAHATTTDDPHSTRRRRLYRISPAGVAAWRAWMHAPTARGADAETTVLAKVFLLGRLDDDAEQRAALAGLRRESEAARDRLKAVATDVDSQARGFDAAQQRVFVPQRATLDYGIRAHELLVGWLGELEEGLS